MTNPTNFEPYDYKAARANLLERMSVVMNKDVLTLKDAEAILWGPDVNSHERLWVMLALLTFRPEEECWPVVLQFWTTCDLTGSLAAEFLGMLEVWHEDTPMVGFLDAEAAAFFRDLPERVTVYRGGNAGEWLTGGIAWTTDRAVALGFAHGHRGLRNRKPRIAKGVLDKSDILAVFVDRAESEILTAPRWVKDVTIEDVSAELGWP